MTRRLVGVAVVVVLVGMPGCGGRSTVAGTVKYEDGTLVEDGTVIGEATVDGKLVSVQGPIQKNGSFTWGGDRAGDGALPGNYKVIVVPAGLSEYQVEKGMIPSVDGKYTKYETSGLAFEVKPGKNQFDIIVTKPKSKVK